MSVSCFPCCSALDANLRHTHGEMFSQIHCVGHSFGGQTIRVLQQLLSEGAFEEHCTCAGWIRSITCISSPLNGSLAVYALGAREVPLGRLLPAHAAPPPTNAPKHTPSTSSPPLSSCWRRAVAAVCSTAAHVAGWHQPVRCCSAGYLIGMVAHLWELVDLPHLHEGIFHFDVARFGVGRRRRGCAAAALHCGTAGCPVGAGSALFQHANCAPADMTLQGAYLWNRRILHQQDTYYFSFVGDSFGLTEARGAAHDVTGDGGEEGEEGLQAEVAESTKSPCPRRSLTRKVVSTLDPPTDTPTATASAAGAEVRPVFLSEEGSHADGARTVLRALQWHVGWHTPWMDRSCFPFVVHPGTGAWGPSAWMDGGGDGLLALPEQAVPLHTPAIGASGTTCLLDARKHVQSCSEARPIALSPPPFVLVDTPPVSSDFANWMKSHSACAEPSPSTPAANSPRSRLRFQPRAGVWHVLRHGSDHVGVVPAPVGSLPQAGFFARLWRLLDEVDVQCG